MTSRAVREFGGDFMLKRSQRRQSKHICYHFLEVYVHGFERWWVHSMIGRPSTVGSKNGFVGGECERWDHDDGIK